MPFYREERNEYKKNRLEEFLTLLRFQSEHKVNKDQHQPSIYWVIL